MYRIFDFSLACDMPLPELSETNNADQIINVQRGRRVVNRAMELQWSHEWHDEAGEVCIKYGRSDKDILLQFPNVIDFLISCSGDTIHYFPEPDVPEEMVRHLLLDQVIPRIAGHKGRLVLHASAVVCDHGAIIFLGDTGSGKSTLAAGFCMHDYEIMTDDCILLSPESDRIMCIPCYPGIRLWDDSYTAVVNDDRYLSKISYYAEKRRLHLQDAQKVRHIATSLNAVFILDDKIRPEQDSQITIVPVSGAAAVMDIIKQSFVLDVHDKERMGKLFAIATVIANSGVKIYRLGYPHDYQMLNNVQQAVIQTLKI